MSRGSAPTRRTVGIGSMVVDRLHRVPRILGADEKGILRGGPAGSSEVRVGGVVLNHLGWAAVLGLPTGIFGKQADDEGGRFLRAAMDRVGIERDIVLDGSASSRADIYVDDEGARAANAAASRKEAHVEQTDITAEGGRLARSHTDGGEVAQAASGDVEAGTQLGVY